MQDERLAAVFMDWWFHEGPIDDRPSDAESAMDDFVSLMNRLAREGYKVVRA